MLMGIYIEPQRKKYIHSNFKPKLFTVYDILSETIVAFINVYSVCSVLNVHYR